MDAVILFRIKPQRSSQSCSGPSRLGSELQQPPDFSPRAAHSLLCKQAPVPYKMMEILPEGCCKSKEQGQKGSFFTIHSVPAFATACAHSWSSLELFYLHEGVIFAVICCRHSCRHRQFASVPPGVRAPKSQRPSVLGGSFLR